MRSVAGTTSCLSSPAHTPRHHLRARRRGPPSSSSSSRQEPTDINDAVFEHGDHLATGWQIAGLILWIALLAGVTVLAVLVFRRLAARPGIPAAAQGYAQPRSAALDELDLRYARGEIARDEYLGRRADLLSITGMVWAGGLQSAPTPPAGAAPSTPPPGAPPAPPAAGSPPGAPPPSAAL